MTLPRWLVIAWLLLTVANLVVAVAALTSEPAEPSGMTKGLSCEIAGYDLPTYAC